MSLTKTAITTVTYAYQNNFFVDVQECDGTLYFYLYNAQYGVKKLMFGARKQDIANEEFMLNLIEGQIDDYVEQYTDEVF